MSVASPEDHATGTRCVQCGASLADDQEWCLECGAAQTLIHKPPDWKVPIAIIGTVVVLALIGFLIALATLSSDANRSAAAQVTTTVTAPSQPAATAAKPTVGSWPPGLPGWTVVLATSKSKADADAFATRASSSGTPAGLLSSSEHPSMAPGMWVVFSGRYPTQAAAQAAIPGLAAKGNVAAKATLVGSPGGR
jgi:amino acid transporter